MDEMDDWYLLAQKYNHNPYWDLQRLQEDLNDLLGRTPKFHHSERLRTFESRIAPNNERLRKEVSDFIEIQGENQQASSNIHVSGIGNVVNNGLVHGSITTNIGNSYPAGNQEMVLAEIGKLKVELERRGHAAPALHIEASLFLKLLEERAKLPQAERTESKKHLGTDVIGLIANLANATGVNLSNIFNFCALIAI